MIDLEFKTAPAPTLAVARPDSKFTRDERATPDVKPSTQALSQLRPPRISGVGAGSPWSRERDARARGTAWAPTAGRFPPAPSDLTPLRRGRRRQRRRRRRRAGPRARLAGGPGRRRGRPERERSHGRPGRPAGWQLARQAGWRVGWWAGGLVGWWADGLVGRGAGRRAGEAVGWPPASLAAWLHGYLADSTLARDMCAAFS